MTAQVLDSNLQSAGIRAIVTSRAKNPTRLETKVRQRNSKKLYATIEDVYNDIVDLAGVRVALYFPAEREEVGRIIKSIFASVADPKEFPTEAANTQPTYSKRFSGYWATHYRVCLPETLLNESQKRYAEAKIEIQVASVLMHAWSEVEHDLVYKPMQGQLSEDEYAILDELNGLVLTGEIALERLQRAGDVRVSKHDLEYTNHYDLASSLLEMAREELAGLNIHESVIGRVDLLFYLLKDLKLNTPEQLAKYVAALHTDFESRPLAEQVIDQLLSEDAVRYSLFEQIRLLDVPALMVSKSDLPRITQNEAIGQFMSLWIEYEKMLRDYAALKGEGIGFGAQPIRLLRLVDKAPEKLTAAADRLRRFRNQLVHGIEVPDAEFIRLQAAELRFVIDNLRDIINPETEPVRRVPKKTKKKIDLSNTDKNG